MSPPTLARDIRWNVFSAEDGITVQTEVSISRNLPANGESPASEGAA